MSDDAVAGDGLSHQGVDLTFLPAELQEDARQERGEVSWSLDQAGRAILALADAGCVVLGLDIREYDAEGLFLESPWSALPSEDSVGPSAVLAGRDVALAALTRWCDDFGRRRTAIETRVLVTWRPEPDWEAQQLATCARFGVTKVAAPPRLKVGAARNLGDVAAGPINGLRHRPTNNTSGWYLWRGGEPGDDAGYFEPAHGSHLLSWCPDAIPYLGLPPGWRFQIAQGHEDVWKDDSLLDDADDK